MPLWEKISSFVHKLYFWTSGKPMTKLVYVYTHTPVVLSSVKEFYSIFFLPFPSLPSLLISWKTKAISKCWPASYLHTLSPSTKLVQCLFVLSYLFYSVICSCCNPWCMTIWVYKSIFLAGKKWWHGPSYPWHFTEVSTILQRTGGRRGKRNESDGDLKGTGLLGSSRQAGCLIRASGWELRAINEFHTLQRTWPGLGIC